MCPRNMVGTVDLLMVSHHGLDQSNSPALVQAVRPVWPSCRTARPKVLRDLSHRSRTIRELTRTARPVGIALELLRGCRTEQRGACSSRPERSRDDRRQHRDPAWTGGRRGGAPGGGGAPAAGAPGAGAAASGSAGSRSRRQAPLYRDRRRWRSARALRRQARRVAVVEVAAAAVRAGGAAATHRRRTANQDQRAARRHDHRDELAERVYEDV
jgi:hypothetical protein